MLNGHLLSELDLEQVASYLAFRRYKPSLQPSLTDEPTLAALYAEFAAVERELAKAGMDDHTALLMAEDASRRGLEQKEGF